MPPKNKSNGAGARLHEEPIECFICAEPCLAFCVFLCGHFTCYGCGLRIHSINHGGCPVCRVQNDDALVTQTVSQSEDQFSEEEVTAIKSVAIRDRKLKCLIDGAPLAEEMAKLYEFLCPMEGCWAAGEQEPFFESPMLQDHLQIDHKMKYCGICLECRPAFLCEQTVYSAEALQQHMEGKCVADSSSFTGHPPCKFCHRQNRFYDGEALLKHMQQRHFTCDLCNRGQFTFTFFENRNKLNQHFERAHKICDHPDCASLDIMVRVYASDIDLAIHKQRVHGCKSKALFTPGTLGFTTEGSATGGLASTPATGSNTNVIQITFDHIYRKETVEMMPAKADHGRARRGKNKHAAVSKNDVHHQGSNGLPEYYRKRGVLRVLTRPVDADPSSPTAGQAGQQDHAFGVSESTGVYNFKNKIPASAQEQQRLLNEIIQRELSSPVAYAHFCRCAREFIDSNMLTSEYYDVLSQEIFADPEVFKEVFPLLVATVPNEEKKMALREVWKMRMAPENQRATRVRHEEELAQQAAAEANARKAQEELQWKALRGGSAFKSPKKSNNKANAWASNNAKQSLAKAWAPSPAPASASVNQTQSIWEATSPGWGSQSRSSPVTSNASAALASRTLPSNTAENFPSLPQGNARRAIGKKPAKRPNAWFKK